MTKSFPTKISFFWIGVFILFTLVSCRGGIKCGPLLNALEDADSDCLSNASDNCPFVYNPNQIDEDQDNVGASCDLDDTDSGVGSTTDFTLFLEEPDSSTSLSWTELGETCQNAQLGLCQGVILGVDQSSEFSEMVETIVFQQDLLCDTLSSRSKAAVFCQNSNSEFELRGYLELPLFDSGESQL